MLKIYIPNKSTQVIGGGFTFIKNIMKGSVGKFEIVNNWKDCDIVLIVGATLTDRIEIEQAKQAGKKIIFRIDGMTKDSRNRGTAVSRTKDFAKMADWIVFQSKWAKEYVGWWLKEKVKAPAMNNKVDVKIINNGGLPEGLLEGELKNLEIESFGKNSIIYNGVDADYFYKDENLSKERENTYLVVQYNRDENKRTPEAFYDFIIRNRYRKGLKLKIVGNFSPDIIQYNFDFFDNEKIEYEGIIENPKEMGDIMRQCKYFYFPAFADASSNVLAEALVCGCEPLLLNDIGGSKEVYSKHKNKIYSIGDMSDEYLKIFKNLI